VNAPALPPLDDPRWLPLTEAHRPLSLFVGSWHLAARDLTAALASRVCSMRRRISPGSGPDRERLEFSFWEHEGEVDSWSDRPTVVIHHRGRGSGTITSIKGFVFYAWKPNLEEVWPTVFPPPPPVKSKARSPQRGTAAAWILELHPKDWHLQTAGVLFRDAADRGCTLTKRSFQRARAKLRGDSDNDMS
jgi:hypothetical protein